ncbi:ribbon-helix-helix protein, CopG family [Ferrovibrio sp.]|uniref:ribbon-helix-helix protein, CopG family n=1 Tax=Ferrovibrio sp. TaxID=1917215 RepID=UPI00311D5F9B
MPDPTKSLPVSVRLPPQVKDALMHAAADDQRSISNLIEKVLTDWLRSAGYLQADKAAPKKPKR